MNHGEIVSFILGVANLIRDTFRRGRYQDVILPLTVLRRLDCALADTKELVLAKQAELRGKTLENLDPQLRKVAGYAFYNTSRYDFEKLLADAPHVAANLRNFYLTLGARTGKRSARALAVSTLESRCTFTEAFRLLGFRKMTTFNELGRSLGVLFCWPTHLGQRPIGEHL